MNDINSMKSKFTLLHRRLSKIRLCFLLTVQLIIATNAEIKMPPSCKVFCSGNLLHIVQTSHLYKDDKYFVDMKMKYSISNIFSQYHWMMNKTKGKPQRIHVRRFVRKCFSPPGSEFQRCRPRDWTSSPKIIANITDRKLKDWALELNKLWKVLCRKVRQDVHKNSHLYSAIYVPNLFIIPGGRHREYYYWDSYWIVLGLLRTNMYSTAKGIIENFIYLTQQFGFVPNGGRVYYLERSNFPLLIPMVDLYYKETKDKRFIAHHLSTLEKEFGFWMDNRVVEVPSANGTVKLARYSSAKYFTARPDSYTQDIEVAKEFKTDEEKKEFYWNLKAACEAGWNFSSRWFVKKNNTGKLKSTMTQSIIPVDLNAILFENAQLLSKFFKITNDATKEAQYKTISETWKESITKLLWSEEDGIWFDYDVPAKELRKHFYISNIVPLWTKCYDEDRKDEISEKVLNYLNNNSIQKFIGGIPASLWETGNFWDFPNAIPPTQHMLIMGLESTGNVDARNLAFKLANNWIRSNYMTFINKKTMYNTYHATRPGSSGQNQFMTAQAGYGWTNGVVLDLLHHYGKRFDVHDIKNSAPSITSMLFSRFIIMNIYLFHLMVLNLNRIYLKFNQPLSV